MTALSLSQFQPFAGIEPRQLLVRAVHRLLAWQERARSRNQLAALDDHLLRDIGIDRATAATEADKAFWRP